MQPSDTTAGSRRRNDSAKRPSSKARPTDKQRHAKKQRSGKHSASRSLVRRKRGNAEHPPKDARPPSRPITPSVRELNWRMFDAVVCAQILIALTMAFVSLSLGAIGVETAYVFVMAILLSASTVPSLYNLHRHDIEGAILAFSVLQLVSASCSLMVCAVAIFAHDYADFSDEDRAYIILIFVVWQYASVVFVSYKPYTEVTMKDLKARLQRLRGQKQKESRGRSSSSAKNAPSRPHERNKTDHVVVRMEPQQQGEMERAGRDDRHNSKGLNNATQNQGAKIADTKANAALPVGSKVATSQTSKLESSKLQPATAAKNESNIPKTSTHPTATSVSDVDVAMKQVTSPCRNTLCPTPVSSTYANSTHRP